LKIDRWTQASTHHEAGAKQTGSVGNLPCYTLTASLPLRNMLMIYFESRSN